MVRILPYRRRTVAARVHHIFQSLGLRHLAVVEPRGFVVGIITRKDLGLAGAGTPSSPLSAFTVLTALTYNHTWQLSLLFSNEFACRWCHANHLGTDIIRQAC